MAEITKELSVRSYEIGKSIWSMEISKQHGIQKLISLGMNPSSADIYLKNYECMINGVVYKNTMNEYTTKYYLVRIFIDDGKDRFMNALNAISQHLEYQSCNDYNNLNGIRTIYQNCLDIKNNNYESVITAILNLL